MRFSSVTAIMLIFFLNNFYLNARTVSGQEKQVLTEAEISKKRIDQLLDNLDSSSRKTRAEAKKKLEEASSDVIPYLKMKLQNGTLTPSASNSVSSILKKIEKREIQRLKNPVKIKYSQQDNLESILNRLDKETGNEINFRQVSGLVLKKQVSLPKLQSMTFWQALNLLEKNKIVRFKKKKDSPGVVLVDVEPSDKKPNQLDENGLFRITLKSVRIDSLPQDKKHSKLRIHYKIISEPRIYPLILFYQPKNLSVVTKTGISISPLSPASQLEISLEENNKTVQFHVDYLLPESVQNNNPSFKLNGTVNMLAATFKQKFQISLNGNKNENRRHLLSLKIHETETEKLKNGNEVYRISLLADYDLDREKYGMLFESHRRSIFKNSPFLIHRKTGTKTKASDSHNHLRQDSNLMLYKNEFLNLDRDKNQYLLQFPAYTAFELIPIQFEFQNVIPVLNSKEK
jgi:hypothetical protein